MSCFDAIWQPVIKKAFDDGPIQERFCFYDIRRKAATDAERLGGRENARQLLGHTMQYTTVRYISGEKIVKPLK